jgi:formylglycine-generating enzyme required for sulfatase activity
VPSPTPWPDAIDLGGATMILVPGGRFEMGAAASDILAECNTFRTGCDVAWFTASAPRHEVLIAPFYIDQFEVTNVAYLSFLNNPTAVGAACDEQLCLDLEESLLQASDAGGYQVEPELATHPVTGITWPGAAAFCEWRGSRLPSEAEWEKAALWNPETGDSTRYPWGDAFDGRRVNFCDAGCDAPQANPDSNDGFAATAPVGSYPDGRSAFGVYDMAGNVWEWTGDWFSETTYAEPTIENPTGPAEGTEKVVRGGSWFDTGNFTSGFIRFPSTPENADKTIGFRCAISP